MNSPEKAETTEYIPAQPHAPPGGDEGPESEEETMLRQPDPMFGVPETWDEKKREGSESECEVRQKPT